MTHLGGFFIKRKLDSADGKDILYRKCLHEVSMEGGREGEGREREREGGERGVSQVVFTTVHGAMSECW